MKKIVALVLAMVMVLGLATTAMAAGTAVNRGNLEVYLDGPTSGDNNSSAFAAELKVVTAAKDDEYAVYEVVMTAKKNGVVWEGKEYDKGEDFTLEVNSADEFVIVASPVNADFAVVDGKTTTWLAAAEDFNDAGWDEKASMIQLEWVENSNKWDCNAIYAIGPNNTILFMYEGVLYVETALDGCDYLFNVGGMAVPADKAVDGIDYYFNPHTYAATYKWGVNGADVEEVYCLCNGVKTTFDFAVDNVGSVFNARKAFGDDYQYALLIEVASGTDLIPAADVYVEKVAPTNFKVLVGAGVTGAATGTAPEAGETVTSPKTFDAGIAMYVGMSVMAAAGSAVVLKKKD